MGDGLARRAAAIDVDEADLGAGMAADEDEGDAVGLQARRRWVVDGVAGEDESVDVAAADDALVELLDGAAILRGVHEHGQVVIDGVAGIGGALDEEGVEGIGEDAADRFGDEEAEDAHAAGGEAAGGGVGVVVVEADDVLHAGAGGVADPAVAIDDAGDGGAGDTGEAGDLLEGHGSLQSPPRCE